MTPQTMRGNDRPILQAGDPLTPGGINSPSTWRRKPAALRAANVETA